MTRNPQVAEPIRSMPDVPYKLRIDPDDYRPNQAMRIGTIGDGPGRNGGIYVAHVMGADRDANAERIVRFWNAHDDLVAALRAIKRFGELACVQLPDSYPPGGKKPPSKDVWQFPRHLLTDIDAALVSAESLTYPRDATS